MKNGSSTIVDLARTGGSLQIRVVKFARTLPNDVRDRERDARSSLVRAGIVVERSGSRGCQLPDPTAEARPTW